MRPRPASRRSGRGAIALLAALALCLQILVPAIGTTAHWVRAAGHHGGQHASLHHAGQGASKPASPEPEGHHGAWGLCCIIGGGKLGTAFAPPPSAQVIPPARIRVAAVVQRLDRTASAFGRASVLPVGARAPPQFA